MLAAVQTVATARRELGSRLVDAAEDYFDIPVGSVQNPKRRNGRISQARWAVSHVLTVDAGWSQPKIGRLLGCDPSSVHNGLRRAQALLRTDAMFFEGVTRLQREITPQ
jgi:hypothetical protein